MSKMKRKWLQVIEYEETGHSIDATTYASLMETHPDLPILADEGVVMPEEHTEQPFSSPPPTAIMQEPQVPMGLIPEHLTLEPRIDTQLDQQIQQDITAAGSELR
jgi:hypothetical protein